MENKKLPIIIVVILVIVALATSLFIFTATPEYKNITMNGITLEVPDSEVSVIQQTKFFSIYNDTENNVDVLVFDSTDAGLSDLSEAMTFAMVRDTFQVGAIQQTSDGLSYNYSDTTKVYSYVGNYSHKNLLIITKNKDDMIHVLKSVNVDLEVSLNDTNKTEENVSNTETTKKSSTSTKTTQREDEKVIDGWDPKEHEVSRESLDDGMEKVYYDDDYFRIVDSKGNIVTYGY